jgi:hypothetical protein
MTLCLLDLQHLFYQSDNEFERLLNHSAVDQTSNRYPINLTTRSVYPAWIRHQSVCLLAIQPDIKTLVDRRMHVVSLYVPGESLNCAVFTTTFSCVLTTVLKVMSFNKHTDSKMANKFSTFYETLVLLSCSQHLLLFNSLRQTK